MLATSSLKILMALIVVRCVDVRMEDAKVVSALCSCAACKSCSRKARTWCIILMAESEMLAACEETVSCKSLAF